MKAGREHRVPLSQAALDLLRSLELLRAPHGLVFPGLKKGFVLTDMTLSRVIRRMGRDFTVHGFRSTFRDWAGETTNHANHVVEQALAHSIGNAVEAAYRRGNLFQKRVALMNDWASYLASRPAEIIPIRATA
jgi:integrase